MTDESPRRRYKKRAPASLATPSSQVDEEASKPATSSVETFDTANAVSVGLITGAHGIKGEVRVSPLTDFPQRFDPGAVLWLDARPIRVERSRWQRRDIIVKFEGVDTRNDADALRGRELQVPSAAPLDNGVFYQHDVIGLRAVTPQGEVLGRIADVLSTGSADVYVVRGDRGELLLPAIEDVVREIDVANGRIVVELLEGLEFTRAPAPRRRRPSGEEKRLAGESGA